MNALAGSERNKAIGLRVFESLRAEDEPWLSACFVPPPDFERLMDDHSVVIFGGTGCGKTALCQELRARSRDAGGRPIRLLVDWRPLPPTPGTTADSGWVYQQVTQILDTCAVALAWHLVRYPSDFSSVPGWARNRLIWFIHRFTQGSPALRLGPLMEGPSEGARLLHDILQTLPPDVLYDDAAPDHVAAEIISALSPMGLDSVWVMTDGLEGWAEAAEDQLTQGLKAFLSTLSLFERSGLVFKLCVSSRLEPALSRASGLLRRRVNGYQLKWDIASLQRLVEARLSLATGLARFTLKDLCDAQELAQWLETVGGASPREWLDQVRPLVEFYLSNRLSKPIDEESWKDIRRQHPPRVYLDDMRRRVVVGGREVSLEDIPAKAYEILRYLYERGGQVVSKGELYFRIYRGFKAIPRSPADDGYEAPKQYEGLIDTNLWRLRKAIEPDPSDPVLLVTVRGHGVRLAVRW